MLISIRGSKGAGKTTLAQAIKKDLGEKEIEILSFATPLKMIAEQHQCYCNGKTKEASMQLLLIIANLFPERNDHELILKQVTNIFLQTPIIDGKNRELLINIGTGVLRKINPDVFCNYMEREIKRNITNNKTIIVDDCRMKNEYQLLKKYGFIDVLLLPDNEKRLEIIVQKYGEKELLLENNITETALKNVKADIIISHSYDGIKKVKDQLFSFLFKEVTDK